MVANAASTLIPSMEMLLTRMNVSRDWDCSSHSVMPAFASPSTAQSSVRFRKRRRSRGRAASSWSIG